MQVEEVVAAITGWIFLDLSIRDIKREKGLSALLLHIVGIDVAVASAGDEDESGVEDKEDVLGEEGRKSCASDLVGVVASDQKGSRNCRRRRVGCSCNHFCRSG